MQISPKAIQWDIVVVTCDSEDYLPRCVQALSAVEYDRRALNLVFVDNASQDDTLEVLRSLWGEYGGFGGFQIIENEEDSGFAGACNQGAAAGRAPFVFFLTPDAAPAPDMFTRLDEAALAAGPRTAAFECRCFPMEAAHHVNPVTLETPYFSGGAVGLRRGPFEAMGGFDHHIPFPGPDRDLAIRLRAAGFVLRYVPGAVVYNRASQEENPAPGAKQAYTGALYSRLLLGYKYGDGRARRAARKEYKRALAHPEHHDHVRPILLWNYVRHFVRRLPFSAWHTNNRGAVQALPRDLWPGFDFDRGQERLDAPFTQGPFISVVVRTCGRPDTLAEALVSLRNQTYKNFEVIVTEDGPPLSRDMVATRFADLPVQYICTGEHIGRGPNGNRGVQAARGEYVNFLDDDDWFYPDHLERMARQAADHPRAELILGSAMGAQVGPAARGGPRTIEEIRPRRFSHIDSFTMSQENQIPIQSGMFRKSLFQRLGGLREDMDTGEDWAMWLGFMGGGRRIHPKTADVTRATSVFTRPHDSADAARREEKRQASNRQFYNDPSVRFTVSMAEMRSYYDDLIADMRHLERTGELGAFLARESRRNDSVQGEKDGRAAPADGAKTGNTDRKE